MGTEAPAHPKTESLPTIKAHDMSMGAWAKRRLLGPAKSTANLHHERLGKPTALAVFASDNLSSVAYATEEILKASVPIVGLMAFALVMPLTLAILAVLAILVFSYRQTIKAYPSAGGAYIVTKDNLGLIPAQVAGIALLIDYVLTVAVSVAAGIAALTSALPSFYEYRVILSIACILLIVWGNLRGVRESGRMFAVPTYFFIAMMGLLLVTGLARVASGTLDPLPAPPEVADTLGAVSLFMILHAFASGGAAVTGVEAISNGVPAFKAPSWKNARATLVLMASLLGTMFLGLSFLAVKLQALPVDEKTVISQVGKAVFGYGSWPGGKALFLMLQVATMLILVLAANTAFADFPRLANFHAGDDFMPRQLTKRGHRLVYSNGIIWLALAAIVLVIVSGADVHTLIPLYAIGVFTSFTLSQSGMAKRHLRLREPGWKVGLAINGLGAVTTAVVTIVIAITKFVPEEGFPHPGAWTIMVLVPILVLVLVRMNRRYQEERVELEDDLESFSMEDVGLPTTIVVVQDLDHPTLHAIRYAKIIRSQNVQAVHFQRNSRRTEHLLSRWLPESHGIPIKVLPWGSDLPSALAGYVGGVPEGQDVNVILPGPTAPGWFARLKRDRYERRIAKALLPYRRVRLTLVRDRVQTGGPADHSRWLRHDVIVLIDRLDRAALHATRYGISLGMRDTRGVHAVVDPDIQEELIQRWIDLVPPIVFELIECWDRNVPRSIEARVIESLNEGSEVTVVLPRRDYPEMRQRVLHDRTSRKLIRTLARYSHVNVAIVPYLVTSDPTDEPLHRGDLVATIQAPGSTE